MAFTAPKYEEIFETVAPDNVLAIVLRDMKLALDYFYLSSSYPDFAQRTLGQFVSLAFPALAVDYSAQQNPVSDAEDHLESQLNLDLFIAVTDASAATVTRKLGRYVRALKAVLRAASNADWISGTTKVTAVSVEVESDYGLIGKNPDDNLFMRPAHLALTIRYTER